VLEMNESSGAWQETCVSGERYTVVGRMSSPSLETRERRWVWQEIPFDLRFERWRGSGGQEELSLARNEREGVDVAENTL